MILSICDEPTIMNIMRYVVLMIKILKAAIPIVLIITVMIKFASAITKHDNDLLAKTTKSVVPNLVAAVLIFLVPTFVDIVVKISFPDSDYTKCISGITIEKVNAAYNKKMDTLIANSEESLDYLSYSTALAYLSNIKDPDKKQEYENKLETIKELIKAKEEAEKPDPVDPDTPDDPINYGDEGDNGIFHGTKYNLTEDEIIFLANVGYCEQGSVDGVKAEVSLAANLFELQTKHKTLIDYVKNSGWFACAKTTKKANQEQIEATRDVIVNGNRTMPLYINEHDCSNCSNKLCTNGNKGDICKIVVNGKTYESMDDIKNRSNYIKNKTVIYNKYGGVYTFYSFPCERCDPFGYTESAYKKRQQQQQQQQQQQSSSDSGTLKIYYLGIGRYDGFLITGNNTTLFIDGGYVSHGKKAIEFIKSLGITKIDGLIGSHMHNNHIDAHKEFIRQMSVSRVYYGENPGECISKNTCIKGESDPDELMSLINSKNIPMTILKPGKDIKIGNLTFDIVGPETLKTSGSYRENYNSLNMILKFGKNKFYFSGDYVNTSEILKNYDSSTLDVDIFKWPHHGQLDVSNKFLDVLTPSYIIVPNSSVTSQAQTGINHSKAKGYATGTDGYILAESDGTTLKVSKVNKR